jgi:hypothetical protein
MQGIDAMVDVDDPAHATDRDWEEEEADRFALTLLTGSEAPTIHTNIEKFNAPTLANAVERAGLEHRIEPGTLALCLAFRTHIWPVAMSALNLIYGGTSDIGRQINDIATSQLDWGSVGEDAGDYLHNLTHSTDA